MVDIRYPRAPVPLPLRERGWSMIRACRGHKESAIDHCVKAAVKLAAALFLAGHLSGCATLVETVVDSTLDDYFSAAAVQPAAPVRHELAQLPFSEYWTGIVFNGEKIGFSRLSIRPAAGEPGYYEIDSEASFLLRFLAVEKKVQLKARDTVSEDLTLVRFTYTYFIDDSEMKVSGRKDGSELVATIVTGGKPVEQRLAVEGTIYPSSVIALYPVIHGLMPGREYAFRVYSGELQAVAEVTQRVVAYQASRVFHGDAFKVETRMHGQRVLTWIDGSGRPVFELASSGVMISALEEEEKAKRYVTLAALNKKENLIEFSIVRPDEPIANPRAVSAMKVALADISTLLPSDTAQRCTREKENTVCEITRSGSGAPDVPDTAQRDPRYLSPSITVQSRDPAIRRTAREIVTGAGSPKERITRIVQWMDANVEKAPVDVFSALDVLEKRKAECQGHAYLFTAFARASGIPTRIVNGLAYSEQFNGFLYHSWAESLVDGRWVAVDPTFGQLAADATHIKVVEGETLAEFLPLMEVVGKVKIRVLAVEHQTP